jgi:hypothetical protein
VLLGDVVELRHGPLRDALREAEEPMRQIAGALPDGAEVVIVPGNHDHHLVEAWLERRSRADVPAPLGLECDVDWEPGETLHAVAGWLGAGRVRACYPGVWLRPDVYAMHGHYCDRHTTVPMFERLAAGLMARIVRDPPGGPRRAEDYEGTLAPIYAWIHAVAQAGGPNLGASSHGASAQAWRTLASADGRRTIRRRALIAGFPALVAVINRAGLGPVKADLSGPELRRAGLRATAEVVDRLAISAAHVIFGHTHRAGPLPADDPDEWRVTAGRLLNTGSWVHEPRFLGDRPRESPYRAGFAAVLHDEGAPQLRCLLDGVQTAQLALSLRSARA